MANRGNASGKLERKKTMLMNWAGLGEVEDDNDQFFESSNRLSNVVPVDLGSSSDEEGEFDDCRISFSATLSPSSRAAAAAPAPDYDIWMSAPGSITERRRRLLNGMGLESNKSMLKAISIQRVNKPKMAERSVSRVVDKGIIEPKAKELVQKSPADVQVERSPQMSVLLVRSRSDSDIESSFIEKKRKEDMLGKTPKSKLTRTASSIGAPRARICPYFTPARASPLDAPNSQPQGQRSGALLSSAIDNTRFNAFFLIKNLDTGKEFIVKEYGENGMWNRLSDLQTGKQLTIDEFEKSVGHSSVVKNHMRRENTTSTIDFKKFNSYVSKSLRVSKKRGTALLKNLKDVAHSVSTKVTDKEKDPGGSCNNSPKAVEQKQEKNNDQTNQWVKVRLSGKSHKELSALHLCQEIQAHQGSIWTMKFSPDAHLLASAGEDCEIHVWEVQECEILSTNEGSMTPVHPSMAASTDKLPAEGEDAEVPADKKKKGKGSSAKKGNQIPDYVHAPETVFSLSDKPICSFTGHLDDVLDLSWSRSNLLLSSSKDKTVRLWDTETQSCLKLFAHNDYVTCVQFNPLDEDYFISGSLDAKIRIWNIPNRQVVEWTDLNEMVTAVCYSPDGQAAFIGSHKGNCRLYSAEDSKLEQTNDIDLQNKKKAQAKKITAFQFSPINPSEVLVTSADSRIRILDGTELVQKFRGFKNTCSQMTASYTLDAKHIVCASEDSQVYVWRHEEPRPGLTGKKAIAMCTSYEAFPCKDVSVAIPWHGVVKGEPPPTQSKKPQKKTPAATTTTQEAAKKTGLPPLPKKNGENTADEATEQPQEEEPSTVNETENNTGASLKPGDSPSISTSSRVSSWSWFDGSGSRGTHLAQQTGWGMVIVTATIGGEIRAYQNFGLPRKVGRQGALF